MRIRIAFPFSTQCLLCVHPTCLPNFITTWQTVVAFVVAPC